MKYIWIGFFYIFINSTAMAGYYFYLPGTYGVNSGFSIPVHTPTTPHVAHDPMYVEYNGAPGPYGWGSDPDLDWVVALVVDSLNSDAAWTRTDQECYRYSAQEGIGLYWYWYGGTVGDFGAMLSSPNCDDQYGTNRHSIHAGNSKFTSCPDGQAPLDNNYPPTCGVMVCTCDELKNEADNTCTPMAPLTEWQPGDAGQFFTFPDNNHDDAPRCSVPAPEKDGLPNSCEKTNTSSADPIDCATGQKKYFETDYSGLGLDALSFRRLYESPLSTATEDPLADSPLSTGHNWQPRDLPSLSHRTFADGARATTFRLGRRIERIFFFPAGSSTYSVNTALRGIELLHEAGNDVVTLASGQRYVFNDQGQITQDTGAHQQPRFTYGWTTINGVDRLARVINRFGRFLDYQYTNTGELAILTDQDGVQVLYQYASDGKLLKVIYPDTTPELTDNPSKTYLYEDDRYPDYVTGILNQAGDRIANIAYDAAGKATLSELYNGNDRVEVSYPTDGEAIVRFYRDIDTNAYREEHYFYGQFRGKYQLTTKQITRCDNCDLSSETWIFNDQALLARHTSPEGTVTEWTYDAQDRLLSTTVGVGTPEAHTETVNWHDTLNEIESQSTATELTSFRYDAEGNRTNSTVNPAH